MKVVILGHGGREHALLNKVLQSSLVDKVYIIPGNDGILDNERVKSISQNLNDFENTILKILSISPDLVIVGPEKLLARGYVDILEENNITVLGPRKDAAILESSKVFSKEFMRKNKINTAVYKTFSETISAINYLNKQDIKKNGIVIKKDGLASGKGVVVTHELEMAIQTVKHFLKVPSEIIIEDKINGYELSCFALCDGDTFINLGHAKDYKRLKNGNLGPNTGGMGSYSYRSDISPPLLERINNEVFKRVIQGMKKNRTPFKGILYAGLMINGEDINVLEFNVRFGDPEAQTILPLIQTDIVPILIKACNGALDPCNDQITFKNMDSIHVVMASMGYSEKNKMFTNQDIFIEKLDENVELYFSGVTKTKDKLVNSGGRVLGLTVCGNSLSIARELAYKNIEKCHFKGAQWRDDIGLL